MPLTRPRFIRLFELFFLGSLALTLLSTALVWPALVEQAADQAGTTKLSTTAINVIAGGSVAVLVLVELLLWYFVARRGSTVAKWILALVTAYNLYALVGQVRAGAELSSVAGVLSAVALLLQVIAVGLLFTPGASGWFADEPEELVP